MSNLAHVGLCFACISMLCLAAAHLEAGAIYCVDDDAPNDPGPGDPAASDAAEDGSPGHPFDAIQEAIEATTDGDEVVVSQGRYTGPGNRDLDFRGKAITVRSADPQNPAVVAATIIDCQGAGRGLLFHSGEGPDSVLEGILITNGNAHVFGPYASEGGAIACLSSSSPTIRNCIMAGCHASGGSAISCRGDDLSPASQSSPKIAKCTMIGGASGGAGAINAVYSSARIIGCVICGNGAGLGGGVGCSACNIAVVNCLIAGNVADTAGGISCQQGNAIVTNCTITGNSADEDGGGGVAAFYATVRLTNCILWDNRAYQPGPEIAVVYPTYPSRITVCHSDVRGGGAAVSIDSPSRLVWGEQNMDTDPLFVDADGPDGDPGTWQDNDYRLVDGSPCVDWGDNRAIFFPAAYSDVDGNYRIVNCLVDLGSHEFQAYQHPPDQAPTLCGWVISRKQHDGLGELDLHLQSGRNSEGRLGGVTKLILVFSEPVAALDGQVNDTEVALSLGQPESISLSGHELSVEVANVPNASCLEVSVAGFVDSDGNPLPDGGRAHVPVLFADTDGDGAVNISDLNATKGNLWAGLDYPSRSFSHVTISSDVNTDGLVHIQDLTDIKRSLWAIVSCP